MKTIRQALLEAVEWAERGQACELAPGETRKYGQEAWDCGTACCLNGAFSLIRYGKIATDGPDAELRAAHPLVASLMFVPDSRVLPIIAAIVRGGDGEAEAGAARAAGLQIALSGEQTINGGVGWAYNNATQTVNGGLGCAFDTATQTVNGGEGCAFDTATQTVNGGEGRAYNNATQTVNGGEGRAFGLGVKVVHHIGTSIRMESKDYKWVETSRVTKGPTNGK